MESSSSSDRTLEEIESIAVQLVREAGQIALERFRLPMRVEFKGGNPADPVTETDREIEGSLRSSLSRQFPGHVILGEEGAEVETTVPEFLWVLDPLDGTTNFLNGLPLFSCSIGLLHRGEPVVGALFLPVAPRPAAREMDPEDATERVSTPALGSAVLHARLGGGTFLEEEPVHASEAPAPEPSSLGGLPGHHARQFVRWQELRYETGDPRCLGTVCYETALVACGVLRYSVFRKPKLWDVAAGALIVREAGGLSLQWQQERWVPLSRFEPRENPKKKGEMGLRYWTAITLVGGDQVARFVASRLRPRLPLREQAGQFLAGVWGRSRGRARE